MGIYILKFIKMSGSGNDFVMLDNRDGFFDKFDKSKLAKYLCRRKISVGADGVIFLEKSDVADIRMNYFNADGSSADMCGNGARCTAFVYSLWTGNIFPKIETGAGTIDSFVDGEIVKVGMPRGRLLEKNIELSIDGLPMLFDLYDTGVPHAVNIVDDLDEIPVDEWGREIRFHKRFQPDGANADFVQIVDKHKIAIRTYERGVESETSACGTGAVASAISATRKKLVSPPVDVEVLLPDILTIDFHILGDGSAENITLLGKVYHSFDGQIEVREELNVM